MAGLEKLEKVQRELTPQQFVQLSNAVASAIAASTERHSLILLTDRNDGKLTQYEENRRIDMCIEWAIERRFDDHWTIERVCDNMTRFLKDALDTKDTTPNKRTFWAAEE